jgi:hypothetical protein
MHLVISVKCPLLSPDFNQNWNILTTLSETPLTSNFINIHSPILELLHVDRRTDMAKLRVIFFSTSRYERARNAKRFFFLSEEGPSFPQTIILQFAPFISKKS